MYPKDVNDSFGIFVFNFHKQMVAEGFTCINAVIRGKSSNVLVKILKYVFFIGDALYKIIFEKYDVIYVHHFTHSMLPFLLCKPRNFRKIIINAHGFDVLPISHFGRFLQLILRSKIISSDLCVVPSQFFSVLAQSIYGFEPNRIFISPSGGVDFNTFKLPHNPSITRKKFKLGFISRIDQGKGWLTFLRVVYKLKSNLNFDFHVVIGGTGAERDLLKFQIEALGLSSIVSYVGSLNQKEMVDLFHQIEIFVFPTELKESLGLVALEAMACGCLVIASRIGAIPEYVLDGLTGFLFNSGDIEDLSATIVRALNLTVEEKAFYMENAFRKVKEYDSISVSKSLASKIVEEVECSEQRFTKF